MAKKTNAQLIARLRETANLATYSEGLQGCDAAKPVSADTIRDQTRLYRETWLAPIIDEIEARLVKPKKEGRA